MTVLRIVPNIAADDPALTAAFHRALFGLEPVMEMGWIITLAAPAATARLSLASTGGSGQPVPDLSIEVDDLDAVLARAAALGIACDHGAVTEPWGVRQCFPRDPAGRLPNILTHA